MPTAVTPESPFWTPPRAIRKVAVIGAGACGMPIAKHLRVSGKDVRVFERNAFPGGIWKYQSERVTTPQLPALEPGQSDYTPDLDPVYPSTSEHVHASPEAARAALLAFAPPGPAYETLKNNIPTPLMAFRGMPRFADTVPAWYHSHSEHQKYLEAYAAASGINGLTSFNTRVEKADVVEGGLWRVWTKRLEVDGAVVRTHYEVEDFDAVVAASGHHNAPATPDLPGLREWQATWPDRLSHALSFRRGEDWRDRRKVLVVGSGPSGSDMAREISVFADEVFVTTRPFEEDDSPDTKIVKQVFRDRMNETCTIVSTVRRFLAPESPEAMGKVELVDGSVIEVDAVLFATGYYHSYPFLKDFEARAKHDPATELVHGQYTVLNLHQDLFYIPNPTLVCLGVPANISAFSFFEYQGIEVTRVWSGQAQLPSIPHMREAYAARRAAVSDRNIHVYGKVEEPRVVKEIAAWLNAEAARLGIEDEVETLAGYSEEYMAVKARTVEGLHVRDSADDARLSAARAALCKA